MAIAIVIPTRPADDRGGDGDAGEPRVAGRHARRDEREHDRDREQPRGAVDEPERRDEDRCASRGSPPTTSVARPAVRARDSRARCVLTRPRPATRHAPRAIRGRRPPRGRAAAGCAPPRRTAPVAAAARGSSEATMPGALERQRLGLDRPPDHRAEVDDGIFRITSMKITSQSTWRKSNAAGSQPGLGSPARGEERDTMSREELAPLLEAGEEAGCLNLSEFSAAAPGPRAGRRRARGALRRARGARDQPHRRLRPRRPRRTRRTSTAISRPRPRTRCSSS